jgi:hypothetical protein
MLKKMLCLAAVVLLLSSIILAASAPDYFNYGNALFKKGEYKKAITYYTYAARMDQHNPDYYNAIAACYKKLGNKAASIKYSAYAETVSKRGGSSASADVGEKIKVAAFAGFTTAAMAKANSDLASVYASVIAAGGTGSTQNLGGGFIIGAQGGYSFLKGLYVGPRLELISVFSAKTSISISFMGVSLAEDIEYGASITDFLAGASYYLPLQGMPVVLSADLHLGYGSGGFNVKGSGTGTSPQNLDFSGGTFVTVISVNGEYKLTNSISAGLTFGYRLANVARMNANMDYPASGYKKGDPFKDSSGAIMPVDFSGIILSLNGSYSF